MASPSTVLLGDIGGTHLRLGLARGPDSGSSGRSCPVTLEQVRETATGGTASIEELVQDYLRTVPEPLPAACFIAAAGPVHDRRVALTNADLSLDAGHLTTRLGMPVTLVNDFTAMAWSIPMLQAGDRRQLGGGAPQRGAAIGVMGPGTGLGVSGLVACAEGWTALAGEGGHARLCTGGDEREQAAYLALAGGRSFVAAEDVLSGPGLARLYAAIGGQSSGLTPAAIAERARRRQDAQAVEAVRLFTLWLGRQAGDLALVLGARGGVYLTGGILPAWGGLFEAQTFRCGFEDKGDFRAYLAAIPTYLVVHPYPGLLGLASLCARP